MTEKPKSFVLYSPSMLIVYVALTSLIIMMGPPAEVFAPPAPSPQVSDQSLSASEASLAAAPMPSDGAPVNATDNMDEDFGALPPSMATAEPCFSPDC